MNDPVPPVADEGAVFLQITLSLSAATCSSSSVEGYLALAMIDRAATSSATSRPACLTTDWMTDDLTVYVGMGLHCISGGEGDSCRLIGRYTAVG